MNTDTTQTHNDDVQLLDRLDKSAEETEALIANLENGTQYMIKMIDQGILEQEADLDGIESDIVAYEDLNKDAIDSVMLNRLDEENGEMVE